jgi:putative RNA 2'-phosphotransferase
MARKNTRKSRLLSLILRHKPETVGLTLDESGWLEVDVLLQALAVHGKSMSRSELESIVADNDKKRFAFSDDGSRIRAVQGHSLDIDLGLRRGRPPAVLYHGTVGKFLGLIMREGLKPMERHHVHLSADRETAFKVGSRRGAAVILEIDARRMAEDGKEFFLSENGVWLTESVEPEYLTPQA